MSKAASSAFLSASSSLRVNDVGPSAWTRHAPFVFWLTENLAPKTLVELGTHFGLSYFAVCEIIREKTLLTKCYAVDTWLGNKETGLLNESVYASVVERNQRYTSFSQLVRKDSNDASNDFLNGSIDLLHISGRKNYENAREDFGKWRVKMSDRGIILFHNTNVIDNDFSIGRFFSEIKSSYVTFEFLHGRGLGVLAIRDIPAVLYPLMKSDEQTTHFFRNIYSAFGEASHQLYKDDVKRNARERLVLLERQENASIQAERAEYASMLAETTVRLNQQYAISMQLLAQVKKPTPTSKFPTKLRRRNPFVRDSEYKTLVCDYEELASSPLFDADWYVTAYPNVIAQKEDPVHHFLKYGASYSLSPGPLFNTAQYFESNPDVRNANLNPLLHFARRGVSEQRSLGFISNKLSPSQRPSNVKAHQAALHCVKTPRFADENALFVTHSPDGRIKPHVVAHVTALRDTGVAVTLIIAAENIFAVESDEVIDLTDGLYIRKNVGLDFAAWAHILAVENRFFDCNVLYLINDSIIGPTSIASFSLLMERIRSSEAGLIALTESNEHEWHVQSFFLAFKKQALSKMAMHRFFSSVECLFDKNEIITRYELKLASLLRDRGVKVEVLFPLKDITIDEAENRRNVSLFNWKQLLAAGCPYVKVMALRDADSLKIDICGWREILVKEGYNVLLADEVLSHSKSTHGLSGSSAIANKELRVAFIGPWNYGSGLGYSSRGYLSALWHCRSILHLNIHPITQPFHIHPRIAPTSNVCDFIGDADVALVHLNPDAWPVLLSEKHRHIISKARRVIGLWVWEMDEIPKDWRPGFALVDEIWAPSQFCADVFARATGLRIEVKVVPYVVSIPPQPPEAKELNDLRRRCVIPDGKRVILYCFDGSSYLVRKNPFALIEAFKQSGLATSGWMLVLKTKNMYEFPLQAERLERLAGDCSSIKILNRPMSRRELELLMASADIYASSHCSEGFGLTIAEAMALSKHVVATNFGGSCDFLDSTCGYPVDFTLSPLAEDHGHYTKGKSWANVDEGSLTRALQTAASAILAGNNLVAECARERIANRYSPRAIGAQIDAAMVNGARHER